MTVLVCKSYVGLGFGKNSGIALNEIFIEGVLSPTCFFRRPLLLLLLFINFNVNVPLFCKLFASTTRRGLLSVKSHGNVQKRPCHIIFSVTAAAAALSSSFSGSLPACRYIQIEVKIRYALRYRWHAAALGDQRHHVFIHISCEYVCFLILRYVCCNRRGLTFLPWL